MRVFMTLVIKKQWLVLLLFILIVFSSGCIFSSADKEKDKEKDDITPQINSLDLSEGAIVLTRDLIITWEGNKTAELYQYALDGVTYDWTESTYVELTDLDETEHIFTLQARKDSVFSSLYTRNFIVDAIQGPGIVFSPRKVTSNSVIVIGFEDVQTIMSAHIEIVCESGCANLNNFLKKESLEDSGSYITLSNDDDPERLVIDIAFAGYTDGINGSPVLGSFSINPLHSGKISVDFEKTRFKNTENIDITIEPTSLDWVVVNK